MGRTATNPQTGEKIEWDGRQWRPVGSTAGVGSPGVPTFKTPFLDELAARGPGMGFDQPVQSTGRQQASPLSGILPQSVMPPSVQAPAPVEPEAISAPLAQENKADVPSAVPLTGNNAMDSGGDPMGAFESNFPDMHDPLMGEQFMTGVDRLKQGTAATLAGPDWRALQTFDRIDRGEVVPETEDPAGYQYMAPEQRAQVRADAQAGMAINVNRMTEAGKSAEGRMKNPVAGQVIQQLDQGNYGQAWQTFQTDPGGVIQQTALESAALALPAAAVGLATGPVGGVTAAMSGMAAGNYPLEYGLGLVEQLDRLGVNTKDPAAVQAALRDPSITAQMQQFANSRGIAVSAGEAAFAPIAKMVPHGGAGVLSRIGSALGHSAVEVAGEMGGEAAGQQAVGDNFQLGQVLAEGVGAGPTAAVTAGVSVATPPVTPPTASTEGAPRVEPTLGAAVPSRNAGTVVPRAPMAVPSQFAPTLDQATKDNGLPPNLLANMMITESNGNPNAVSPAGARGLMQFMGPTAKQYGVDPTDPVSSINGAGRYMSDLMNQFGGNVAHAVAAYNWGPGNVRRWLREGGDMAALPAETRNYIAKVLGPDGGPGMAEHYQGVRTAKARAPWASSPTDFTPAPETRTIEDIADLAEAKRLDSDELNKLIFGATGKSALEDLAHPDEILTAFDALSDEPVRPSQTHLRNELEDVVSGEKPVEEIVAGTDVTLNPTSLTQAPQDGSKWMVNLPGWDEPEAATVVESYHMEDGEGGIVPGVRLQNAEGSIVYDGPTHGVTMEPIGAPSSAPASLPPVSSGVQTSEGPAPVNPITPEVAVAPELTAPTAATPSPLSQIVSQVNPVSASFSPVMNADANVTVSTSPTSIPQTPTGPAPIAPTTLQTSPSNLVQPPTGPTLTTPPKLADQIGIIGTGSKAEDVPPADVAPLEHILSPAPTAAEIDPSWSADDAAFSIEGAKRLAAAGEVGKANLWHANLRKPKSPYWKRDGLERLLTVVEKQAAAHAANPEGKLPAASFQPITDLSRYQSDTDDKAAIEGRRAIEPELKDKVLVAVNKRRKLLAERGFGEDGQHVNTAAPYDAQQLGSQITSIVSAFNRYARSLGGNKLGYKRSTADASRVERTRQDLVDLLDQDDALLSQEALQENMGGYNATALGGIVRKNPKTRRAVQAWDVLQGRGFEQNPLDMIERRRSLIKKMIGKPVDSEGYADIERQADEIGDTLSRLDPHWRASQNIEDRSPRQRLADMKERLKKAHAELEDVKSPPARKKREREISELQTRIDAYENEIGLAPKAQPAADVAGTNNQPEAGFSGPGTVGGRRQIGRNAEGNPIWEDKNGVRSIVESGIRVTESVQITPGGGFSVNKSERGSAFLTDEERQTAASPEVQQSDTPEDDGFEDPTGLGFENLEQVRQYDMLVERLGGEKKPSTQFHVLPVKPEVFAANKGHAWLLSWAYQDSGEYQLREALERGDKVILDNGAYTHWQRAQKGEASEEIDWDDFYSWAEDYANRYPDQVTVIIPDVIMGSERDNDVLVNGALERIADKQFRAHQLMPVWHTHESIERLERLATEFDRIAFGATGDQAQTGTLAWHTRLTEAFDAISDSRWVDSKGAKSVEVADGVAETPREPKVSIHMLRGSKFLKPHRTLAYPFDSADSSNVARNAHRQTRPTEMPNKLAAMIDVPRFWNHHLGAEAFAAIINGDAAALAEIETTREAPHQKAARERKERDGQAADAPKAEEGQPEAKPAEADAGDYGTPDKPNVPALARRFALKFANKERYATIAQARTVAAQLLGGKIEAGSPAQKAVDEAIELGAVIQARSIVRAGPIRRLSPKDIFDDLVDLYFRMPTLGTRTSTSIAQQAYSTPVPLAYVASRLAGINAGTTVYEPSAGNGALLIGAKSDLIVANELNPDRHRNLRAVFGEQANIHEGDATTWVPAKSVDVVIANPPFGVIRGDNGKTRKFRIPFSAELQKEFRMEWFDTGEIDHAISFKALDAMKDDGSAVLILGGVNKLKQGESRSDAYNAGAKRNFFLALYRTYNVVDHFTVSGDLYQKQGAGWPVDVIVIRGRGRSARKLPASDVPRQVNSWEEVGKYLDAEYPISNGLDAGRRADTGADGGAAADGTGEGGHAPVSGSDVAPSVGSSGGAEQSAGGGETGGSRVPAGGVGATGGRADTQSSGVRDGSDRNQSELQNVVEPSGRDAVRGDTGGTDTGGSAVAESDRSGGVSGERAGNVDGVVEEDLDAIFERELAAAFGDEVPAPKTSSTVQTSTSQEDTRSTPKVATDAAKSGLMGLDEVASGLTALFGAGPNRVTSGIGFDKETYEKAKPFFEAGVAHFADAGADVAVLIRRLIETLRDQFKMARETIQAMQPYVVQFVKDVKAGVISLASAAPKAPKKPVERKADEETEGQVAYEPKSKVGNVGTLVPRNLRTVTRDALDALAEREGGDLDTFVAKKLGYDAEEVGNYFSAEQIDAIALGIDNIDKDAGFIIGDQTGVGKGRVVAAMIRYAIRQDKTPIFATEKPNLYKDMYRDLGDIGMPGLKILMTNAALSVPMDDDETVFLKTPAAGKHNADLMRLSSRAALKAAGYDVVFTTYSQMQPIGGDATARMRFLANISDGAFVILDESHNAGGTEGKGRGDEEEKEELSRATFAREILGRASSVFYSSATYAKRPQSMSLYFKTDMRLAVGDIKQLADLIASGGVPMQQVVASMLARAGQYIRRERSFAGVTYDATPVPVDTKTYDRFADLIFKIQQFSEKYATKGIKAVDRAAKEDAKRATSDNSTGGAGASSTNFTSVMHNLIDQMLLAAKAKSAVDLAVQALERGEKPVLTVANTMGSFLADFAEQVGISPGDAIKIDFNELLDRYIERTRWYTEKRPFMKKGEKGERKRLSDDEIGDDGVAFFEQVRKEIAATDFRSMPVSPIDYMASELRRKGYKVGEITGRTMFIDYQLDGKAYLRVRPESEKNIAGRLKTIMRFNGGESKKPLAKDQQLDVMILNQAGATGLSLHANAKFGNQSKRQMIIVQAEKNIDTHMQMLGRVHRTGQVITPSYIQMVADVPAEKRPAAVLAKKMASLSANTTASRKGALSAEDTPDFMNQYGDQVAARIMNDDAELHHRLGDPLSGGKDGEFEEDEAMRKVTGRIPLLPLADQLAAYELLESEYNALIEQLDASGENALEAKFVELDAKTLSSEELAPANGRSKSPFAAGVTLERVDVKRLGKPPTTDKIISEAAEAVGVNADSGTALERIAAVRKAGKEAMQALFAETYKNFKAYKTTTLDDIEGERQREATRVKLDGNMSRLRDLMAQFPIGSGVRLRTGTAEGNVYGTVVGFKVTGKAKNPAALGSYKVTIQTLTAGRQTLPLSQLWPQGTEMATLPEKHLVVENAAIYKDGDLIEMYDQVQADRREERYMVTGNLLAGFSKVQGKGSIVNYTDDKGDVHQGILLPRDWDPKKAAEGKAVTFTTVQQVQEFLKLDKPVVSTTDGNLTIVPSRGSGYTTIVTGASKADGGKYYLNSAILDAAGRDFVKVAANMRLEVPNERLPAVLQAIHDMYGVQLQATTNQDEARKITGQAAPKAERLTPDRQSAEGSVDPAVFEILASLVNRMTGGKAALLVTEGRLFLSGGQEATGFQWENFIATTLAYGVDAARQNVRHETIHILRELGLFSDEEWAALTRASVKWRKDFMIDQRYADVSEEMKIEEAIAAAFSGEHRPASGPIATIFVRIHEFLRRFYRMLISKDFRTADDIFRRVESGEIGARPDKFERAGIARPDRTDDFFRLLDDLPRNADGTFAVKTELLNSVRKHADNTRHALRSIWKGVVVPQGVDLNEPPAARDLNVLKRFVATPASLFKAWPELDRLVQDGIKTEIDSSVWVNRLNKRYTAIRKDMTENEWGRTAEALWAGDEAQINLTDDDLKEFGLTPKEVKAFRQITELLETLARVVDMHRRQMLPQVRKRKLEVEKRMKRLASTARVMSDDDFVKKLNRRTYLTRRMKEGKGDPAAITAEIQSINDELASIRMADPDVSRKYDKLREEYDALEARLAATSVRRREGYVPHKFYGGWRLHEETGTDADGNPVWKELTSDQGFYDDKVTALRAAEDYLKAHPNANLKVEPKTIKFPFSQEGTQLSDAAYERFVRKVAENAGVQGEELGNMIRGVARKRFRRRIYAAGQYRTGHKGWNRDIDRVMRTHIGQSVRYVTMDKMKFNVINTMEGMGLSPYKVLTREQKVLYDAFDQWWRDLNGQKQTLEEQFDSLLNKEWVTPLRSAMVTAGMGMALGTGTVGPVFGAALGGYLGYRMYRATKSGGDFKTRALTGSMLSDVAHLKLGAFFNVGSALVNLSQLAINTYPVLGEKWATVGIARAVKALVQSAMGKTTADITLLGRADVDTSFRFAETHPGLFKQEGKLAQMSMFFFQKAETMNRATTFLGALARAEAAGKSHGDAVREAKAVLLRTQFHYGAANKPELLRNVFARLPLQFKAFMVNQITFAMGLRKAEIPRFLAAMVLTGGLLGLPGLQLIDAVTDYVSGVSPIQYIKDKAIDTMASGNTAGTVASMVARGLPGAMVDITSRVGMGDKFLPSQWSDLQGPWLSTITSLAEMQAQGAGAVDQLRAVSGGAAPLKALEALANGLPLSTAITDPKLFGAALTDDETLLTNPYMKGAKEYEPTKGELALKAIGLKPIREAQLGDIRAGAEREKEKRLGAARPVLTAMVAAWRTGGDEAAEKVVENAAKRGIEVTADQIKAAFRNALTDREIRVLKMLPRVLREDVNRRTQLLKEFHAQ
jgi:hypothetical protein